MNNNLISKKYKRREFGPYGERRYFKTVLSKELVGFTFCDMVKHVGADLNIDRLEALIKNLESYKYDYKALPWYEENPELLKREKIAMAKAFPHFNLEKLDDGRLCWFGELEVVVREVKHAYYVMAVYYNDEEVRIYPVEPDFNEMFLVLNINDEHYVAKDSTGNLYFKLDRFLIKESKTMEANLSACVEWLRHYEVAVADKFVNPLRGSLPNSV